MTDGSEELVRELTDQLNNAQGAVRVLSSALRDIDDIVADYIDLDAHGWNSVYHIIHTSGVKAAMKPTE